MRDYYEYIREDTINYFGFYKVLNLEKIMEDFDDLVEYNYDPGSNLIVVEGQISIAYKIIKKYGGKKDNTWRNFSDYPTDGVLIKPIEEENLD